MRLRIEYGRVVKGVELIESITIRWYRVILGQMASRAQESDPLIGESGGTPTETYVTYVNTIFVTGAIRCLRFSIGRQGASLGAFCRSSILSQATMRSRNLIWCQRS